MSATSDEIKIDLDELDAQKAAKANKDTKKTDDVPVKTDAAVKTDDKATVTPDAGVERLKKQLAEETVARQAAEQRAREATEREAKAKTDTGGSQLELVKGTIASLTQANDVLGDQVADLQAAGDFKGAQKLQRQMVQNEAKVLRLEEGKVALEKHLEEQKNAAPASTGDPVEDLARQLTPASASWVRAHPEFARDTNKYTQMIAAHNLVRARGVQSDTDEYFSAIEKILDVSKPFTNGAGGDPIIGDEPKGADNPLSDAAKPTTKAAPAAAPVTRSGSGPGNQRTGTITLSPEQREMARATGQTDEEFARNIVALRKEGRLN